MEKLELCSFCQELKGPESITLPLVRQFFVESSGTSRILVETDHVFVVPSLGALVPGHILVLPKAHYYSVAEIPQSEIGEFEFVVEGSRNILLEVYGHCSAFEHGCIEAVGKAGACIDHAHLHMVPLSRDLRPLIEKRFGRGYRIQSLRQLKQFFDKKTPYLYYEGLSGKGSAYDALEAPSQFFRQLIYTTHNDIGNWDWKADLRVSVVGETYMCLKNAFAQLEKSTYATRP